MKERLKFLQLITIGHNKYQKNSNKAVIKAAASRAYDDMNQIRFIWNSNFPGFQPKKVVLPKYLDILKKFNYKFSMQLIHECYELFGYRYEDNAHQYLGTSDHGFSLFGVCQKLVNMTFKYLLSFNELLKINIDYSNCCCPVDSIILEKIGLNNIIWTKMSEEQFNEVQNVIRQKLNEMATDTIEPLLKNAGLLAYDFLCWE